MPATQFGRPQKRPKTWVEVPFGASPSLLAWGQLLEQLQPPRENVVVALRKERPADWPADWPAEPGAGAFPPLLPRLLCWAEVPLEELPVAPF